MQLVWEVADKCKFWPEPTDTSKLYVHKQWSLWQGWLDKLVSAFAAHLCYMYKHLMNWLIYFQKKYQKQSIMWQCYIYLWVPLDFFSSEYSFNFVSPRTYFILVFL